MVLRAAPVPSANTVRLHRKHPCSRILGKRLGEASQISAVGATVSDRPGCRLRVRGIHLDLKSPLRD
jgi:hypothetical protein